MLQVNRRCCSKAQHGMKIEPAADQCCTFRGARLLLVDFHPEQTVQANQ
jgi:hypothetical protein